MSATLLVPWQYMHAGSQWSHAMSADPTLGANVSVTVTMSAGAQTMSSVPKQCTSEIVGWPKQWDASSTEGTRDNVLIVLIWSFFQAFIDQEHTRTHTSQNCRIHSQIFITFVSKLYHVNCSEHGIGLEVFVFNRRNPILTNVSHAKWSIYQLSTKICSERVICNQGKPKLINFPYFKNCSAKSKLFFTKIERRNSSSCGESALHGGGHQRMPSLGSGCSLPTTPGSSTLYHLQNMPHTLV